MSKRFVLVLAVLCLLAFTVPAAAAPTDVFSDVPARHWSYDAVKQLAAAGIISGDQARFNGDKAVTRYEMAVMVANAMTKLDKADAQQKALIEKLQKEYNAELVKLGARVAKVEAKQRVSFLFDNRLQYTHNSAGPNDKAAYGGTALSDKDIFSARLRGYINVPGFDPDWDMSARFVQEKWNFNQSGNGSLRFDRFYVTGKNIFGGSLDMGKLWLYPGKGGFVGLTGDVDGAFYTKKFDNLTVRMGNARNSSQDLSFAEASYKLGAKADIGVMIFKHDFNAAVRDVDLRTINGAVEIFDGLALSGEYAKNHADMAGYKDKSGYWIALQSKYKATNLAPHVYTQMVNPFVKNDHGWAISYRHMPSGVSGLMNRTAAGTWVPVCQDTAGKFINTFDNVNVYRFDYLLVPWKGVQWTFIYEHIKPIDSAQKWTNNRVESTFNFWF